MPEIVCCGETMCLAHAGPGQRLRHAQSLTWRVGGAESNVAIAAARLGRDSGWMSRLGDDEPGEMVLARVRAEGVDVSAVTRGPEPTGLYLRDATANGTRVHYYRAGSAASRLAPNSLEADYLAGARYLHVTGITPALSESAREFTVWLIDAARAAGAAISFDVNYRAKLWAADAARVFVERVLGRVDLLFVGHDEARALWARDDDGLIDWLAGQGPREVLFKRGGGPCSARIDGRDYAQPAFAVTVVDTTGAGDAFAGGYLAACASGCQPQARLRQAQAVGAACVTAAGDYENLPSAAELAVFLSDETVLGR